VPPGVVTATLTGPSSTAGGVLQVIEVSLTTTTLVAGWPPKRTEVAPVKPVPAMVTAVPPAGGPRFGVTLLTTGAAIIVLVACEPVSAARASVHAAAKHVLPTTVRSTVDTVVADTAVAALAAAP
jgi:hypothetical protein